MRICDEEEEEKEEKKKKNVKRTLEKLLGRLSGWFHVTLVSERKKSR